MTEHIAWDGMLHDSSGKPRVKLVKETKQESVRENSTDSEDREMTRAMRKTVDRLEV